MKACDRSNRQFWDNFALFAGHSKIDKISPSIADVCIYSDLATLACTSQGLQLIDEVGGQAHAELERLVGLPVSI